MISRFMCSAKKKHAEQALKQTTKLGHNADDQNVENKTSAQQKEVDFV